MITIRSPMGQRDLRLDRRQFGKLVSTGGILGLAGCAGQGPDDEGTTAGGQDTQGEDESSTATEIQEGYYDHIQIGHYKEPTTLDPYYDNLSRGMLNVQLHMFDHLLTRRPPDMEIVPQLAKEWEPVENSRWKFNLVEGATYHNGDELTAERVKGSLELMLDGNLSPGLASILEKIDTIETQGKYELDILTDGPFPTLPNRLTAFPLIVHPGQYESMSSEERTRNPNDLGTGPYTLDEWKEGSKIVLSRYDDWWKGTPKIKKLTFNMIPEPSTRVSSLTSGNVHAATNLEAKFVDQIEDNAGLTVTSAPSLRVRWYHFTPKKEEALQDERVRRAINYAIDVESIQENIMQGFGEIISQPVPSFAFGHNPDIEPYPYDPDKAESLLADAGYSGGFDTTLRTDPAREEMSRAVAGFLRQVGIEPEVEIMEAPTLYQNYLDGNSAPIEYFSWGNFSLFDCAGVFPFVFQSGAKWSYMNWDDLDDIIEEATSTADPERRKELWHEANRIVHERAPVAFMFSQADIHGKEEQLNEFVARSDNLTRFDFTDTA